MAFPALWGPVPAMSLVEAPDTKVLGSPPHLHPGSKCEHWSSQRVREASAWLAVFYQECFHKDEKVSTHSVSLLGHSAQGLHMAWENRQAEGRWTGEYWATVGTLTPSIG